jgi:hypothetical protein
MIVNKVVWWFGFQNTWSEFYDVIIFFLNLVYWNHTPQAFFHIYTGHNDPLLAKSLGDCNVVYICRFWRTRSKKSFRKVSRRVPGVSLFSFATYCIENRTISACRSLLVPVPVPTWYRYGRLSRLYCTNIRHRKNRIRRAFWKLRCLSHHPELFQGNLLVLSRRGSLATRYSLNLDLAVRGKPWRFRF